MKLIKPNGLNLSEFAYNDNDTALEHSKHNRNHSTLCHFVIGIN